MTQKPPVQPLGPEQYHEPVISDDQILLIGQVIVAWSKLEAAMEDTIWMLLNLEEDDGRLVTKRLGADAKIQLLRLIGPKNIEDDTLQTEFLDWLKVIDELKEVRNFIAHGVWGTLMPDDVPVALSLKPQAEAGEVISETFPRERMIATSEGIQSMLRNLIALPENIGRPRRVPDGCNFLGMD